MKKGKQPEWLGQGEGTSPNVVWTFRTDADLLFLSYARESGEVFVGDSSNSLYRLDRRGRVLSLTRGLKLLRTGTWTDTGQAGLVVLGHSQVVRLNDSMQVEWSLRTTGDVLSVALDPYGDYAVIALQSGTNWVVNRFKKRVGLFETPRPLNFVRFLILKPELIAAAEHAHLSRHRWNGETLWSCRLTCPVSDMAVSEDGEKIVLAAMNLGVQTYDGSGELETSYLLEGTAMVVAASAFADRLAVATLEGRLYWLEGFSGRLLWTTQLDEPIRALQCDPFGQWLLLGTRSGHIARLQW